MPKDKSIIQHQLEDLVLYTSKNSMVLNSKKTKCLPFKMSRTKEFLPELTLEEGSYLEVIYSLKLVGIVISSDISWQAHVDYTVTRVNKVLWQLIRFKQLGANRQKLTTFYILKVRSILMFGAACYHSALTLDQGQKLELQQKRSLAIILGRDYTNYEQARSLVNILDLKSLRESVCLKWAQKAQSNPKHSHLFPQNPSVLDTRNRCQFLEYKCKGGRFFNSAVPAMTRSLNSYQTKPTTQPNTISLVTRIGLVMTAWKTNFYFVSYFVFCISVC